MANEQKKISPSSIRIGTRNLMTGKILDDKIGLVCVFLGEGGVKLPAQPNADTISRKPLYLT